MQLLDPLLNEVILNSDSEELLVVLFLIFEYDDHKLRHCSPRRTSWFFSHPAIALWRLSLWFSVIMLMASSKPVFGRPSSDGRGRPYFGLSRVTQAAHMPSCRRMLIVSAATSWCPVIFRNLWLHLLLDDDVQERCTYVSYWRCEVCCVYRLWLQVRIGCFWWLHNSTTQEILNNILSFYDIP